MVTNNRSDLSMRRLNRIAFVVCAIFTGACGGGSKSPTSPTPQYVQVGGVWSVTTTVTATSGGECFAAAFQSLIGTTDRGTMQISQNGSSLSATFTSDSDGSSCSYQGTAGVSVVALNTTSCTASDIIGATCPSGARRDIRLQTGVTLNSRFSATRR